MCSERLKVGPARWPALMKSSTAAEYLDMNYTTFRRKLKYLQEHGFPLEQPATGRFSKQAIDEWAYPRSIDRDGNVSLGTLDPNHADNLYG